MSKFKTVAVGGTFDELHKGHKALLKKAFETGKHVLVGLTSDDFVKSIAKPHPIASYAHRLQKLTEFLQKNRLFKRAQIIPLKDAYGPAATSNCIEALVVSKETEAMAACINERRKRRKLQPLHLIVVDLVRDEEDSPISTTRIRRGEIDHEGHLLKACPK